MSHLLQPQSTLGAHTLHACLAASPAGELWLAQPARSTSPPPDASAHSGAEVLSPSEQTLVRVYRRIPADATVVAPVGTQVSAATTCTSSSFTHLGIEAEVEALRALAGIAGVLQPVVLDADASLPFAAYTIEGRSLAWRIMRRGPLDFETTRRVLLELGATLVHAHRCGVVHGALRASVIFQTAHRAQPVIADFGLAEPSLTLGVVAAMLEQVADPEGESAWIAPELWSAPARQQSGLAPLDPLAATPTAATDVYALGLIGAAMLLGDHPASSGFFNAWDRSGLVGPTADLLREATALEPADRPQSVEQFCRELSDRPALEIAPCSADDAQELAAQASAASQPPAALVAHAPGVAVADNRNVVRAEGESQRAGSRTRRILARVDALAHDVGGGSPKPSDAVGTGRLASPMERLERARAEGATGDAVRSPTLRGRLSALEWIVVGLMIAAFACGAVLLAVSSDQTAERATDRENLRGLVRGALQLHDETGAFPKASGYDFWLSLFVGDGSDLDRASAPFTSADASLLVCPTDTWIDRREVERTISNPFKELVDLDSQYCSYAGPSARTLAELAGTAIVNWEQPALVDDRSRTIVGATGSRGGLGFLLDGFHVAYLSGEVEFLVYRELHARWGDPVWFDALEPLWSDPHLGTLDRLPDPIEGLLGDTTGDVGLGDGD